MRCSAMRCAERQRALRQRSTAQQDSPPLRAPPLRLHEALRHDVVARHVGALCDSDATSADAADARKHGPSVARQCRSSHSAAPRSRARVRTGRPMALPVGCDSIERGAWKPAAPNQRGCELSHVTATKQHSARAGNPRTCELAAHRERAGALRRALVAARRRGGALPLRRQQRRLGALRLLNVLRSSSGHARESRMQAAHNNHGLCHVRMQRSVRLCGTCSLYSTGSCTSTMPVSQRSAPSSSPSAPPGEAARSSSGVS
jgi:hypothetical protein